MKKLYLLFFLITVSQLLFAQNFTVQGKVTDNLNEAIPFATIFVKGTTIGTSANKDGFFTLKLTSGNKDLIFSAVGFKQLIKPVFINKDLTLNISLSTEIFELKDVIVKSGGEDPAYDIIRKAIKQRKSYLNQMSAYTCDVYIKGIQRLLKAPEKFLGRDVSAVTSEIGLDSNRTGILYQSESQSILSYLPPNNYKEEMISSKVAGGNRSFSFNRATDLLLNFYENYQEWDGLSNRPFVSPIADNALFYYNYKLIGSTVENGELINKIELLPKRGYDPAYRGFIYIVEDSWRIHSTDFLMTKESNISLLDTMHINQTYIAVNKKLWLPNSIKLQFTGGFLSFKFGGYYVGVYNNYNVNPPLSSKDFKEVLKITSDVNKKDSTYWDKVRPIPLTLEEQTNYVKKDSLAERRQSKPYLDSLDNKNNKFKITKLLLGGYNPRDRYNKTYYHIDAIIPAIHFNTVEGFAINYGASYTKQIDTLNNRFLRLAGNFRYGFSNKIFSANTNANIPIGKKMSLTMRLGSNIEDLNDRGTLSLLNNTINSLFFERNYSKFYQKKFGEAAVSSRLPFGMFASFGVAYHSNKWLPNTSNYAFRNDKKADYSSNNPFINTLDIPVFNPYQNFNIYTNLSYNFSNKYRTLPQGKFYIPSKWPTLSLRYEKAIPNIFGADANYDYAAVTLAKQNIKLGFYGNFDFSLTAGSFINSDNLQYPDFKHFRGNKTLVINPVSSQFLFLDYYINSTGSNYFEGHTEQNFKSFFSNKIPLLRKLKLQELAGFNYLLSDKLTKGYKELYFGFAGTGYKIYYGFSFEGNKQVQSGFKIAYGL
jgi:hypothetical protein